MKYVAILDSLDELSEEAIERMKNVVFSGGGENPYCFDITSIKKAPRSRCNVTGIVEEDFWERAGYDRALRDCGVLETEERIEDKGEERI